MCAHSTPGINLLLIVSLPLIVSACDANRMAPPSAPLEAASSAATPPGADYVATPAGWYHRSCVHEIPNGAHVDIPSGLVRRADGSTFQLPKCLYPASPQFPMHRGGSVIAPPTDNGWIEDANYYLGTSDNYAHLTASWKVPPTPAGSYSGTQLFYSFPGLEDVDDPAPAPYIIQPVIQYGYNNAFGGSYWTAASWRCNSGSDCLHGTPISIAAGDSVLGTVDASNCTGGTCTWTIVTNDVTKGIRSNWTATDTYHYNWTTGGAVEVYGLNTCNQYPATAMYFTGDSLHNAGGSQLIPAWAHYVQSGLSPSCGFEVASTNTTVSLGYQVLTVGINGPTLVYANRTQTWSAVVSGGLTPYTYQWYVNNNPTGNGQSVTLNTGAANFQLRLDVTDAANTTSSVTNSITVTLAPPTNCQLAWIPPPANYLRTTWTNSGDAGVSTEVWINSNGIWNLVATVANGISSYYYNLGSQTGLFYARVRHVEQGYTASDYCNTGAVTVG